MIKRIILVISMVFLLLPMFSQDVMAYFRGESPSFISLNVGCAFPAGRYSQKTIYKNYNYPYQLNTVKLPLTGDSDYKVAGYALPGVCISANGAWYFMKFVGIGLRAAFVQNYLATNKLNNTYEEAYNISENNLYTFNFSSGDYYYTAYCAPGVYFSVPVTNGIFFSLEAGYGVFYSHFPTFSCEYTLNDLSYKEVTQSDSDWGFSYYLAIGMKYKSQGRLGLNFELSYNEFNTEYKLTTTRETSIIESTVPVFYKNLNLSVGVVLFFR